MRFTRPLISFYFNHENKDPLSSSCSCPGPALFSDSFLVLPPPGVSRSELSQPVDLFFRYLCIPSPGISPAPLAQRSSDQSRIPPVFDQRASQVVVSRHLGTRQAGVSPLLLLFHLYSSPHRLLPQTSSSRLVITANQNTGFLSVHRAWRRGPS